MSTEAGYRFEDLRVGMAAEHAKTISQDDIALFAQVSDDRNPVHLDADYAAGTAFKGIISHGMLPAGLISAVLGNALPGPGTIYLGQTLRFKAPVRPGDTVVARVEVIALVPEKRRARLATTCRVGDRIVIEGEAEVLVPART